MTIVDDTGLTYWRNFDDPFCTCPAAGLSPAAISKYDVVVNGRGYMVDTEMMGKDYFTSIPLLRSMFLQDRGTIPIGEHSLNPSDYWRRSVDDWSAGAGQIALDHVSANDNQFRISKGVDPWTIGEIRLLNDVENVGTFTTAFNLKAVVAGINIYVLDNDFVLFGDVTIGLGALTGSGGDTISGAVDIATDGYTIWIADANRVHYALRTGSTFAKYHTTDHVATLIRSAKNRLFTARSTSLYTHSGLAGSAVASIYFTHSNPDWQWTDVTGGPDAVYFCGFSGQKSYIYAATIKADGTALDAPVIVATLPSGEIARSMFTYLGVMCIGTDKGLRFATITSGGGLTLAGLIEMDNAPQCFEGQDRFVWFGWTDYDTDSTGLGRVDLSTLNANIDLFAYASDLMATGQGTVTSVLTIEGKRFFTVVGSGLYQEMDTKVASGTIKSGWMNYALAENKVAIKAAVANRAGEGAYQLDIAIDDTPAVTIGNVITTLGTAGNAATITLPQLQGRTFELGFTLFRSDDTLDGPGLDRWTLMVEPQPERRAQFVVPLLLHSRQQDRLNSTLTYVPADERRLFFELMASRELVPFQDREATYSVIVDDLAWVPYQHVGANRRQGSWDGTLAVTLKVID